jgi:hypothetical protein
MFTTRLHDAMDPLLVILSCKGRVKLIFIVNIQYIYDFGIKFVDMLPINLVDPEDEGSMVPRNVGLPLSGSTTFILEDTSLYSHSCENLKPNILNMLVCFFIGVRD